MTPLADLQREELPGVAKGAAFTLVFEFLDKVLGFAFVILVPRLIGLADFGILNICVSITHILTAVSLAGLPAGIVREGSIYSQRGDWGRFRGLLRFTLRFNATTSLLLGAALALSARPMAAWFLHTPEHAWTLWVAAATVPFVGGALILLQFSLSLRVVRHAAMVKLFFESFLKIVFFLALFAAGLELGAALGGFSLSMAACFLIAVFLLWRLLRRLPAAATVPIDGRGLLRYTLPLVGPALYGNLILWADILLLGYYVENPVVGLFSLAIKVIFIPDVIPKAFAAPVAPRLASLLDRGDTASWHELYHQVGRWTLSLALPCYLFLFLRSDLCLQVLGREFVPASLYVTVLCLGPLLGAALGPAESLLNMGGHSRWQLGNSLVALSVNLVAGLIFLPGGGAGAMAWIISGTVFLYALLLGGEVIGLYRFFPLSIAQLRVLLAAVPGLLFLLCVRHAPIVAPPRLEILLEGFLFTAIYAASLFLFSVNARDREVIAQMMRRIRDHLGQSGRPDQPSKYL
jgi:O-antigen/teichoic acid export membrane protein